MMISDMLILLVHISDLSYNAEIPLSLVYFLEIICVGVPSDRMNNLVIFIKA